MLLHHPLLLLLLFQRSFVLQTFLLVHLLLEPLLLIVVLDHLNPLLLQLEPPLLLILLHRQPLLLCSLRRQSVSLLLKEQGVSYRIKGLDSGQESRPERGRISKNLIQVIEGIDGRGEGGLLEMQDQRSIWGIIYLDGDYERDNQV